MGAVPWFTCVALQLIFLANLGDAISLADGANDTNVITGEATILRCRVDNIVDEQIVWYHQDTQYFITMGRTLNSVNDDKRWRYSVLGEGNKNIHDLLITDASLASDSGTYECGYSQEPRTFVPLRSATLTVLEPSNEDSPQCFVEYFADRIPQNGDFVNLVCQTTGGNPAPNTSWYRDDEMIDDEVVGLRRNSLRWALREEDRGVTFECKSSNEGLREVKTCDVIPYPGEPEVKIRQMGRSDIGGDVQYICETNFGGSLRYRWTSINTDILLENRFKITDSNQVLTILNLQRDDLNTVIECEVEYESFPLLNQKGMLVLSEQSGGTNDTPLSSSNLQTSAVIAIIAVVIIAILIAIAAFLLTRRRPNRRSDDDGKPEPVKFKKIGETNTEEQGLNDRQTEPEQDNEEDEIKTDLRLVDESNIEIHEEKE